MKSLILVSILTLLTIVGCGSQSKDSTGVGIGATNCKLDHPVDLPADPMEMSASPPYLIFKNVRVDHLPIDEVYKNFLNGQLKLTLGQLRFGNGIRNNIPTGHLGVIVESLENFGFGMSSFKYSGGYSFEGRTTTANGITNIITRDTYSKPALALRVQIANNKIVAIEIQHPVRKEVSYGYIATGQLQPICVKEMTFDRIER